MITIYKPNAKNTGALVSFTADSEQECIFIEIVKQKTWDDSKKTGTFDNEKKASIKLSDFEAGAMIRTIEQGEKFHAYHNSKSGSKTVDFSPQTRKNKKGEEVEFVGLMVSVDKDNKFGIGIAYAEAECLKIFLKEAISAIIKKRAKNRKNYNAKTEES